MKINSDIMANNYDKKLERDLKSFKNKSNKVEKYESNNIIKDQAQSITDKKLKLLASEFTSILMKQMFKSMRNTIPENKLINGGYSEEVFTDMLDDELSKSGADQKGFNSLGRLLYQQLKDK